MTEHELRAELATHGKTCRCPHKVACEDREEWLVRELRALTEQEGFACCNGGRYRFHLTLRAAIQDWHRGETIALARRDADGTVQIYRCGHWSPEPGWLQVARDSHLDVRPFS